MTFRVSLYEFDRPTNSRRVARHEGLSERQSAAFMESNPKLTGKVVDVIAPEKSVGQPEES